MIPRTIHQIWLGGPMPSVYADYRRRLRDLYPGFEFVLWESGADVVVKTRELFAAATNRTLQADLMRYEILERFGGIYLDCDMEPVKPIPGELFASEALLCEQAPGWVGTALLATTAGHPLWGPILAGLSASVADPENRHVCWKTGPTYVSRVLHDTRPDPAAGAVWIPTEKVYPYLWREPPRDNPDGYFIHRWGGGKSG